MADGIFARFIVTICLRFWRLTLPMNLFDSMP